MSPVYRYTPRIRIRHVDLYTDNELVEYTWLKGSRAVIELQAFAEELPISDDEHDTLRRRPEQVRVRATMYRTQRPGGTWLTSEPAF